MEILKKYFTQAVLLITLSISLYSCVAILVIRDNVDKLQEDDKLMMEELQTNILNPSDSLPSLTDSLAFYRTEKKEGATIHRFFFKRANYTDSLFNGFSIIVAEIGKQEILIENQANVTLSQSNLGESTVNWQTKLNSLTAYKEPYNNFSDEGLKLKTNIRSCKF